LGRLDGGIGDLLGRHGNGRVLAHGVAGAGDGAADDDLGIHGWLPPWAPGPLWTGRGKALATLSMAWQGHRDAFWLADDPGRRSGRLRTRRLDKRPQALRYQLTQVGPIIGGKRQRPTLLDGQ